MELFYFLMIVWSFVTLPDGISKHRATKQSFQPYAKT